MVLVQTGKTHEGKRHQAGGDHGDGDALEINGNVGAFDALANPRKQDQTSEKPIALAAPKSSDSTKLCLLAMFNSGTPRTAQLVVISGR